LVRRHVAASTLPRVTFGEAADADIRATDIVDRGFDGVLARIVTPRGTIDVTVHLPGRVNLSNVLAATAAASVCDVPIEVLRQVIDRLTPVERRGTSVVLPTGVRVVDDSYNASPAALEAAISTLAATP